MRKLFNILENTFFAILFFGLWLGIPFLLFDREGDNTTLNTLCWLWILAPAGYAFLWLKFKEIKKEEKEIRDEEFKRKYLSKK